MDNVKPLNQSLNSRKGNKMRYQFRIPIGDWTHDGHGHCEWFDASSLKPIEDVREAFFKAQELFPNLDPTKFCNRYTDYEIPEELLENLKGTNAPTLLGGYEGISPMAEYVTWFLNLGDSNLDSRLEDKPAAPTLPFLGVDKKKRYINFIGYGLFSD